MRKKKGATSSGLLVCFMHDTIRCCRRDSTASTELGRHRSRPHGMEGHGTEITSGSQRVHPFHTISCNMRHEIAWRWSKVRPALALTCSSHAIFFVQVPTYKGEVCVVHAVTYAGVLWKGNNRQYEETAPCTLARGNLYQEQVLRARLCRMSGDCGSEVWSSAAVGDGRMMASRASGEA